MKEPKVLTRMRLCECWGDSLSIEELKEVNNYIENLQRENEKLKEQLKQKEDIINKVREYCDFVIREWITDDGFVEEVLKDVKEILDNKGE